METIGKPKTRSHVASPANVADRKVCTTPQTELRISGSHTQPCYSESEGLGFRVEIKNLNPCPDTGKLTFLQVPYSDFLYISQ